MTNKVVNENDLRVVKTRERIEEVFLELLAKEDFSQITVAQIVKVCRISKGTFYYHYKDKYDLAEKMLRRQFARYEELMSVLEIERIDGDSPLDLPKLTDLAKSIADAFGNLSSIHTCELDAKRELTNFLQERFVERIDAGLIPAPKCSFQVSRMLAAIIVAEVEMIIAGETEPGEQFMESIAELHECLARFIRSSN